jgi:hypothetical protein
MKLRIRIQFFWKCRILIRFRLNYNEYGSAALVIFSKLALSSSVCMPAGENLRGQRRMLRRELI